MPTIQMRNQYHSPLMIMLVVEHIYYECTGLCIMYDVDYIVVDYPAATKLSLIL